MNRLQFCCNAIVMALVLIIAPTDFHAKCGQNKSKKSDPTVKKGLRLSAELVGGELFKLGSIVTIKVKLENTSKTPVYLYKRLEFGPGGFGLTILDGNNRWVPPKLIRETFPAPVLSKKDLRAIELGKKMRRQSALSCSIMKSRPVIIL